MLRRYCRYLLILPFLNPLMFRAQAADFELSKVAEGVYAVVRNEPPGLTFVSNTVFIINDDDVVVVDTGIGPTTARAAIAALKTLTSNPVRYVINTHWHDDHMMGNSTWRDAFPGAEFIGHANAAAGMMSTGVSNRKQLLEQGPAFAGQIRDAIAKNENLAGKPITQEERLTYASDVAWAERYFAEAPRFNLIAPTLTVEEQMTLVRGNRVINICYLGKAHTPADIFVHLPKESVVITGDLVVWPIPLFGTTSFPVDYIAVLERLLEMKPALLVPVHGPVIRDDAYVSGAGRLRLAHPACCTPGLKL